MSSITCGYLVMEWASLRPGNPKLLSHRVGQSFGGHWWARAIGLVGMQRQKHPLAVLVGTMVGIWWAKENRSER